MREIITLKILLIGPLIVQSFCHAYEILPFVSLWFNVGWPWHSAEFATHMLNPL